MDKRYADVILDIKISQLDRPFSYRVPEYLQQDLGVGDPVTVPFGKGNTMRKGFIIGFRDSVNMPADAVKDIAGLAPKGVSAEERTLDLAAFLRRRYGGTFSQALKTVLPAKASVEKLTFRYIRANASREELISALGEAQRKHQRAKVRILEAVLEEEEIPYTWVTSKLGVSGQTISGLERSGLLQIITTREYRNPVHLGEETEERVTLNEQQRQAVDGILGDATEGRWEGRRRYLIHGVTGSGKTEVYMALIEEVIRHGRQAIFLIPEIALTYQTLLRFYRRFGNRVSVLHSGLSAGEKYDQCQRALAGEIDVIIGPRSALFTPFPNVGIIILDEEHESSYKSDNVPKYHAREVAEYLADAGQAALVLGSATPSVEAYAAARAGEYQLYRLTDRAGAGSLPTVEITDLRQELASGNRSIFGRRLQELLRDRLARGEQSMLFLNRRGYAGFLSCRACGEALKCPHCDVTLSLHGTNMLQCHYCGYSMPRPKACPSCGSPYLMPFRAGTEQVEEKLKELLPGVRTLRMDRDTTSTKDAYEKILAAFMNGEADVLIGTQMIVKGHDFPRVTLVGVLAADLSLSEGDYRSGERTFQLLTQAVGRAGRAELPGEAVIQTYRPDHYAVQMAASQDYEGFFAQEMDYRSMMDYPPAGHLLAVQVYGPNEKQTLKYAEELAAAMKAAGSSCRVLGPAPGALSKVRDLFRFAIYGKGKDTASLIALRESLDSLIGPAHRGPEFVQFDFDPVNIL